MVCHFVIFYADDVLYRNKFAVDTGEEPATAVESEEAVDSEEYASVVITRYYTALIVGVDMYDVIKLYTRCFGDVKSEILHKTESEAVLCVGIVGNGDLAAIRHHHTEIFFKLLGGVIYRARE